MIREKRFSLANSNSIGLKGAVGGRKRRSVPGVINRLAHPACVCGRVAPRDRQGDRVLNHPVELREPALVDTILQSQSQSH